MLHKKPPSHRQEPNNKNLHRIAISNLRDHERRIVRWWCNKYKIPSKPLEDHTIEELLIEMLEDHYERHPQEIERFMDEEVSVQEIGWDGKMSDQHEAEMQKRFKRINEKNKVDVSKYISDTPLTEAEEKKIMDGLGMNLPKSKIVRNTGNADKVGTPTALGEDFEDTF